MFLVHSQTHAVIYTKFGRKVPLGMSVEEDWHVKIMKKLRISIPFVIYVTNIDTTFEVKFQTPYHHGRGW